MQRRVSPVFVFILAVAVALALVALNVLLTYGPWLSSHPPRHFGSALFWLPLIAAVVILQAMPFESIVKRTLLTLAFGACMGAVLLMAYILGACAFGDCF
jgi:hypothetical protein